MAKVKKDIIVFGKTYKNIDLHEYRGSYTIDTTGIAQIIKQYIKNKYGDIKVWAKSDKYSMGSSVNVYLWDVPETWYKDINEFARNFTMYNEYDGGDGVWRGQNVKATLTDGTSIDNDSPYVFVNNRPPYDAKENDMTPPNYEEQSKPKKKEFQKKGAKFSPTDNLDLILDCGNGWKIYVGKPKEKYLYSCVKDEDTQPIRDKWAEIKSDMLEIGFQWNWKNGTFQRWSTNPDDSFPKMACDVLSKYWGSSSKPKEEEPKESFPFEIGNVVELTHPFNYNNVLYPKDYIGQVTSMLGDEAYVDFGEGFSIPVPFKYLKKFVPKEDKEKESKKEQSFKIPLIKIIDVWGNFGKPNQEFTNYEDLEKEFSQMEVPESGYDKYKFKFEWADGSFIIDRIDVGQSGGDFNPIVKTFEDYIKDLYTTNMETISVMYEYEMKEPMSKYSTEFKAELPKESKEFKKGDKVRLIKDIDKRYYPDNQELELGDIGIIKNDEGGLGIYFDVEFNGKEIYLGSSYLELVEKAPTKEVNLDQYIDDLNLLLELTPNESKKLELATYISDLNTLKLLQ